MSNGVDPMLERIALGNQMLDTTATALVRLLAALGVDESEAIAALPVASDGGDSARIEALVDRATGAIPSGATGDELLRRLVHRWHDLCQKRGAEVARLREALRVATARAALWQGLASDDIRTGDSVRVLAGGPNFEFVAKVTGIEFGAAGETLYWTEPQSIGGAGPWRRYQIRLAHDVR